MIEISQTPKHRKRGTLIARSRKKDGTNWSGSLTGKPILKLKAKQRRGNDTFVVLVSGEDLAAIQRWLGRFYKDRQ